MRTWEETLQKIKENVALKLERDACDEVSWGDAAVAWEIAGDNIKADECWQNAAREVERMKAEVLERKAEG